MKILIGADLVPTGSNQKEFAEAAVCRLLSKPLLELLKEADYRIFNLEVPLSDKAVPIEKCGPALIAPTATARGIKALGTNCVTIANNHIMDQGTSGFTSTLQTLTQYEISTVGGGVNLDEARKPLVREIDGKRIGLYACAEHEFSIAGVCTPGANPFDPLETLDHVAELKTQCDYVIVLYHGGKEHYRYPSPNLRKTCRKMVEKGADLVVCQHSHCIGCEEKYRGGTIVYGQGNFLFDHAENEFWKSSLLIQIGDDFEITYIPLQKHGKGVELADDPEILQGFHGRGKQILQDGFVETQYRQYAESMLNGYLLSLSGRRSLLFRGINKLSGYRFATWWVNRRYTKDSKLIVECEAHRELLLEGLDSLTG